MLINCPNCKELIKYDLEKCPFCNYEINAEDLRKSIREQEKEKAELEKDMIKEAGHRRAVSMIIRIGFVILCPIVALISIKAESKLVICMLFGALFLGFIVVVCVSKYFRCPYCNEHLPSRGYGGMCPHCGGRLR